MEGSAVDRLSVARALIKLMLSSKGLRLSLMLKEKDSEGLVHAVRALELLQYRYGTVVMLSGLYFVQTVNWTSRGC